MERRAEPASSHDYAAWVRRLRAAVSAWPGWRVDVLGSIGPSPSYLLLSLANDWDQRDAGRGAPRLALTAGVHGDEPAGVEAVARLLERPTEWASLLAGFEIRLFPCANPTGYARGTRENDQGLDLNRTFDHSDPPAEVALIRSALQSTGVPDLAIELHEDVDSDGFYLYELAASPPYLGDAVTAAVAAVAPINRRTEIEGFAAEGGIIRLDPARLAATVPDHWPQAIYSFRVGVPYCLTLETPVATGLSVAQRAEIQLIALRTILTQEWWRDRSDPILGGSSRRGREQIRRRA